jgi:hypothetical protein
MHDLLRYIRTQGVKIVVMHGVDDTASPMQRVQKMVKADMIDGFLSVRGAHGDFGNHPDYYVEAVARMIQQLEINDAKFDEEARLAAAGLTDAGPFDEIPQLDEVREQLAEQREPREGTE